MSRVPIPNLFKKVTDSESSLRDSERENMRVFVAQFCCSNISRKRTGALFFCRCASETELLYSPADPGCEDGVGITSASLCYECKCAAAQ